MVREIAWGGYTPSNLSSFLMFLHWLLVLLQLLWLSDARRHFVTSDQVSHQLRVSLR